jgi:hypothetical protein
MNGSLDIGFGKNIALCKSHVVGRDNRYACDGVAMSQF